MSKRLTDLSDNGQPTADAADGARPAGTPSPDRAMTAGQTALFALSDLGIIRVAGEDARAFLHSQLTQDIEHLAPQRWTRAAWCSAKGRVLALMRVIPRADSFDLLMPRTQIEAVLKRLRMFVLRSRVALQDLSGQQTISAVAGSDAADVLRGGGCVVPADGGVAESGALCIVALGGQPQRYLLIGAGAAMDQVRASAQERLAAADERAWHLLEIMNGEPSVVAETQERFVPQMLNLHWLDGISFSKGCYPGQEVVARTRYLGQLKRRLYLASLDAVDSPAPGTPVYVPGSDQAIGAVVDAAAHPAGGQRLLAVLRMEAAQGGELHVQAPNGPALHLLALPYATAEDDGA